MIAEIERKALNEILHLQRERDQLKQDKEYLITQLEKLNQQSQYNQASTYPVPPESA